MSSDGTCADVVLCWIDTLGGVHVARTWMELPDQLTDNRDVVNDSEAAACRVEEHLIAIDLERERTQAGTSPLQELRLFNSDMNESMARLGHPEVYQRPIVSDAQFAADVLTKWNGALPSDPMFELVSLTAFNLMASAARAGTCPISWPHDAREQWPELLQQFLMRSRPLHEAHFYLDDYWKIIWEDAWPKGVAHIILGSNRSDAESATELFDAVLRSARTAGIVETPRFDAQDLVHFIRLWRERTVEALARVAATIE